MTQNKEIFSRIDPVSWINSLSPMEIESPPLKLIEYRRMPDKEKNKVYQRTGKTFRELFNEKDSIRAYLDKKWEAERNNYGDFLAIIDLSESVKNEPHIYDKFMRKAAEFKKAILSNPDPFPALFPDFSKWPQVPKTREDEVSDDVSEAFNEEIESEKCAL